ncbi:alpha/beta hydrolase [Oceanobacillus halophilus]|uniref:Alpha/beta fold hydrolase n=1 Tax=Oceanobacillus halophilus TaxID=930130 RepID=A0A495A7X0_9BACI|nr:alpha/beta fold hydrolase [Oceanobacillus halophilus]RKQ35521.1 alpha/beta fold hydrolase [Oceanobacillus halophilus]
MVGKAPVIFGAEKFRIKGNEIGILISHGFMGTPQSVRYLGERLAQNGYSISAPRLLGHGTHYKDLEKCTHQDWFESLEERYKELKQQCREVFVIGQSMGGTLSLWLANKYPEIKGVILINPALTLPAFEKLRKKTRPRFINNGKPDIKAKDTYELAYSRVPIKSIHELQDLMDKTPAILPEISSPILAMKSTEDHVVPPENTDYILENVNSKEKQLVVLQDSYHVATLDNDKDQIVAESHQFVQQLIGAGSISVK